MIHGHSIFFELVAPYEKSNFLKFFEIFKSTLPSEMAT